MKSMENTAICALILAIILASISACTSNDQHHTCKISPEDSLRLVKLHEQALNCNTLEESKSYAREEFTQAKKIGAKEVEIKALLLLYKLHYDIGLNDVAVDYALHACAIADTLENPWLIAETYHALGNSLGRFKNNHIATKNLAKSFHIYINMHDTAHLVEVWHDLIPTFLHVGMLDSARVLCDRCRAINNIFNDKKALAMSNALSGMTQLAYYRTDLYLNPQYKHLDSAKSFFNMADSLNAIYTNPNTSKIIYTGVAEMLYNFSAIEKDKKLSRQLADSSLHYMPTAIETAIKTGDADFLHRINILAMKAHYAAGDMAGTKKIVDSLVSVAEHSKATADIVTAYRAKSILAAYQNDYKKAFEYRVISSKNKDVLNSNTQSFNQTLKIAMTQNANDSTKATIRETQLRDEAERQATITIIITIILAMLIGIVALIFHNYKRTKKLNEKIKDINGEMRAQSEEIKIKNEEIMDGITYASIIEFAAMPSANEMKLIFGDNLTHLSARDIVSGDFYWASEDASRRYKLLAVGDCTGHGVPGALLSMLGMSILDYTTRHFGTGEISAGIVLDKMRNNFKRTLNQSSYRTDKTIDSIDIALLVFDTQTQTLHYSAAFRPLVLFRYGEFMRMKADSMPIGIYPREKPHFTNNEMKLSKGDIIYLYTDGLTDQDGYENAEAQYPKAYSSKRFFKLLKTIFTLPFDEQERLIKADLDQWRMPKSPSQTECAKTDDSTIVAVAVNNFIKFD